MANHPRSALVVPEGVRRERADKVLAAALPSMSRAAVQRLFESDLVRVKGRPVAKSHRVSAGDVLDYVLPAPEASELVANPIPLAVLFEDDDLIVVDKPPGMVVHPGAGTGGDTLVHALLAHCRGQLSGIGGVERPGIVHRLDKETSGAIVAAKCDLAHRRLARAFARRETEKEYLALVAGVPELLAGTICGRIVRHRVHRRLMTVTASPVEGREARTDWSREESFDRLAALLRCRIFTGRTHQVRVHLRSIGHPILGDSAYGWRSDPRLGVHPPRVMLHAARLAFEHPTRGGRVDVEAPLPADFAGLLGRLRQGARSQTPAGS